jgi:hypothetical protein
MSPTDSTQPVWKMSRTDLWWLLALPVYLTFGTLRHEGSHALLATVEGAKVTKLVIWPSTDLGRFTWGYTQWTGQTDWVVSFAPYLCDLIWFVGFFLLCTRIRWRNHLLWLNLVIFGLISPLVNSGLQWIVGFLSPASDIGVVRTQIPDVLVQLYFLLTLAAYVIGLVAVFWRMPRVLLPEPAPA